MRKKSLSLLAACLAVPWALSAAEQPTGWTAEKPVYYTLQCMRQGRYVTEQDGELYGIKDNQDAQMAKWYMIDRGDGTFDIRNGITDNYITPDAAYNTALTTAPDRPDTGWTFTDSNSDGYVIISNDKVEFNQTNTQTYEYKVFNWSANGDGLDKGDEGCKYVFVETSAPDKSQVVTPDPAEDTTSPVLTILNKTFDGTSAYRVDIDYPEQCAKLFASEACTTVIEYTDMKSTGKDMQMLVGFSDLNSPAWCGYGYRPAPVIAGLMKKGCSPLDNLFSLNGASEGHHKVVIVQNPDDGWWVYIDGNKIGRSKNDFEQFGGVLTPHNVGNCNVVTLGGIVCPQKSRDTNFFSGTVKSARFYDRALTAKEIKALVWNGLAATESDNVEPSPVTPGEIYGVAYPERTLLSSKTFNRSTSSVGVSTPRGQQSKDVEQSLNRRLYQNLMDQSPLVIKLGETITPTFGYTSGGLKGYLYIDLDNNGKFEADELMCTSDANDINGGTFTLPASAKPGVYRARYKVDANDDPAGCTQEGNTIVYNNGVIADVPVMIMNEAFTVNLSYTEGSFTDLRGETLAGVRPANVTIAFKAVPAQGMYLKSMTARYGYPAQESKFGNPTMFSADIEVFQNGGKIMSADMIGESVKLAPVFASGQEDAGCMLDGYTLVWNDEFNEPDGSTWDGTKWTSTLLWPEPGALWHKFNSDDYDSDLRFIQGGDLVLRGMEKDGKWVTGCLSSRYRFAYTYGYLEANVLCEFENGTFSGLWMMPEGFPGGNNVEPGVEPLPGWPISGEIDIWEAAKPGKAHHTIHFSKDDKIDQDNSVGNNGSNNVDYSRYNKIGFEWGPDQMNWYWNGEKVFTVDRSDSRLFGKWPFDYNYFIILQQAVGNPDKDAFPLRTIPGHVYTTRFDYVRVYQKEGQTHKSTPGESGIESVTTNDNTNARATGTYDMFGRRISGKPRPGLYIIDGRKTLIR